MAIKKLPDGRYLLSIRPDGKEGKYVRRICKTYSAALRLESELASVSSSHDDIKLLDLCNLWFDYFGCNLKDGKRRLSKLNIIASAMKNPRCNKLTASHYLNFRKQRLDSGISANTCNHDLAYLKTVFNKMNKIGRITVNPFSNIPLLTVDQPVLTYLTKYQIKRLLVACRQSINESLFPVVYLCLSTGCRWSEAEKLTIGQLSNQSITFIKTKSGKNRTIPLKPALYAYLLSRPVISNGRIFANCLSAFRSAIDRARIKLPTGQCSHVLRHTFASHFIMNGGDILTLQRILGHSDVKVTLIYAHLSPNHLKEALIFSPL